MRPLLAAFTAALLPVLLLLPAPARAEGLALKIATLSPEGTSLVDAYRAASEEISQRTEGRVSLKIYTGGVMGSDDTVLRKMRLGQLHGGFLSSGALGTVSQDYAILGLPLLIRTYDEVDAVRAAVEERLNQSLRDNGLVTMGTLELGFVYVMSNRAIVSKEDIAATKCWIPEGFDIGRDIFEAFGVTPIPLPMPDVLTGLQTGLIDTVANAPSVTLALQWFTAVTHLTDYPLLYTYGSTVFSDRAWAELDPGDQEIVAEVLTRRMAELNAQSRETSANALATLKNQGIAFVQPDADDAAELQSVADQVMDRWVADGRINGPLLDEIRGILKTVRDNR